MVVKVGSSSLTDENGRLSNIRMERIVEQLAFIKHAMEWQVVLVSSGAVAAGLGKLGWRRTNITMPEKQAAAAVGQGVLIDSYERLFQRHQLTVGQLLLTRSDMEDRKRFVHIRNTLMTLIRNGIVPIVNENDSVAVEEIRFGDNDSLAGLVAMVVEADLLVLLTDIDGLYAANPKHNPDAKRIQDVWEITDEIVQMAGDAGSIVGTGGMRTKITAAKIAVNSGASVVIAASGEPDVLRNIVDGKSVGTRFHTQGDTVRLRKSWLTHVTRAEGGIAIDAGAAHALLFQSGSLLMPGITKVEGHFDEGTIVDLVAPNGHTIARGIVNFSSSDLAGFLLRRQLGEPLHNLHEVVHRNDMVLMKGESGA